LIREANEAFAVRSLRRRRRRRRRREGMGFCLPCH